MRLFATSAPSRQTLPTKNHLVAEYALSGIGKPVGIAEFQLAPAIHPGTAKGDPG